MDSRLILPARTILDGGYRIEYYKQVPFNRRLEFIYVPNTFCWDEASKTLYLNGTVQFAGTLYIDHIKDSADITNADSSSWAFPSWSHDNQRVAFVGVSSENDGTAILYTAAVKDPDTTDVTDWEIGYYLPFY